MSKRCLHCFNLILNEDDDCTDTLKRYVPKVKEFPEEFGIHKECLDVYIHREKVEEYKQVLKPIFEKLNRSQITNYDVKAIAEAFFCEHRYLQSEMIMVIQRILEEIGKKYKDPGYIDPRNQAALEWCWKAVQV